MQLIGEILNSLQRVKSGVLERVSIYCPKNKYMPMHETDHSMIRICMFLRDVSVDIGNIGSLIFFTNMALYRDCKHNLVMCTTSQAGGQYHSHIYFSSTRLSVVIMSHLCTNFYQ